MSYVFLMFHLSFSIFYFSSFFNLIMFLLSLLIIFCHCLFRFVDFFVLLIPFVFVYFTNSSFSTLVHFLDLTKLFPASVFSSQFHCRFFVSFCLLIFHIYLPYFLFLLIIANVYQNLILRIFQKYLISYTISFISFLNVNSPSK